MVSLYAGTVVYVLLVCTDPSTFGRPKASADGMLK